MTFNALRLAEKIICALQKLHLSFRGANPSLEPMRNCNNNNSSPLHAVGLAAIAQVARHEAASPARPGAPADFPGVLPTDVVVELPSPKHDRHRPRLPHFDISSGVVSARERPLE